MVMTDGAGASQPVDSNPAMIGIFVKVLFNYCEGWVAVREFPEKGGANRAPNTPFFAADSDLAGKLAAEADAAAKTGLALYVVAGIANLVVIYLAAVGKVGVAEVALVAGVVSFLGLGVATSNLTPDTPVEAPSSPTAGV